MTVVCSFLPASHNESGSVNKSVFSLVLQPSTWHCPQLLLSAVLLRRHWNSLPVSVQNCDTLTLFKSRLKAHLFCSVYAFASASEATATWRFTNFVLYCIALYSAWRPHCTHVCRSTFLPALHSVNEKRISGTSTDQNAYRRFS